jgi:hypothetical protein
MLAFLMVLTCSVGAGASPAPKEKEKEHEGQKVDAGSFGIFQQGHRVGTETFSIYQTSGGSVIESEFKTQNTPPDVQTSEMRLASNGELRRYQWKEISPDAADSEVLPNGDFLTQKWSAGPTEKKGEQPYLLPASTSILDDYFFIHRELLAWKFLGAACKQDKGQVQCPLKQRTQFGTLNPHQHSSAQMSAEFLGREKVTLKGGEQDLLKLELKNDAGTWQLWLDDQFKVMRMSILGEKTNVERD